MQTSSPHAPSLKRNSSRGATLLLVLLAVLPGISSAQTAGTHTPLVTSSGAFAGKNPLAPLSITAEGAAVFTVEYWNGFWRSGGGAPTGLAAVGGQAPGGGTFTWFSPGYYFVNRAGHLAFSGKSNPGGQDKRALFLHNGSAAWRVAMASEGAPGGGVFDPERDFVPRLSNNGQLLFHAFTSGGPGEALYAASPVSGSGAPVPRRIAAAGEQLPTGALIRTFTEGFYAINDASQVVFQPGYGEKLYAWTGSALREIPGSGDCAEFVLNNAGQLVFTTSSPNQPLLSLGSVGGATAALVTEGQQAPGGGTFSTVSNPVMNERGEVAFYAGLADAPGAEGVFLYSAGAVKKVAHAGPTVTAPDGGYFSGGLNGRPTLTSTGLVYFLTGTSGGDAILAGDGHFLARVVSKGDTLPIGQVSGLSLAPLWGVTELSVSREADQGAANSSGQLAYRASSESGSGIFRFTPPSAWIHSPGPDLVVEFAGGALANETKLPLTAAAGGSADLIFTIKNTGSRGLTGLQVSFSGAQSSDYSLVSAPPATLSGPGGSATFMIRFSPKEGGVRSTDLLVTSNEPDGSPFRITLDGRSLLSSVDGDGDGLNDAAEFELSALGFNWQVSQPPLVASLSGGISRLGTLNVGAPLLTRDSLTGKFKMTIQVSKSADLGKFTPFPLNDASLSVNAAGALELQFSSQDSSAFFRLESQ